MIPVINPGKAVAPQVKIERIPSAKLQIARLEDFGLLSRDGSGDDGGSASLMLKVCQYGVRGSSRIHSRPWEWAYRTPVRNSWEIPLPDFLAS